MPATTQIDPIGLVRDQGSPVASQRGAQRRLENALVRAPGQVETRPGALMLYNVSTTTRVRSLFEFHGQAIALCQDTIGGAWTVTHNGTSITQPVTNLVMPAAYDSSETRSATARKNLYFTSAVGGFCMEYAGGYSIRPLGADPLTFSTDYASTAGAVDDVPTCSWSYRFVLVHQDQNGYFVRSPPSRRLLCFAKVNRGFVDTTGTKFYIQTTRTKPVVAGDVVEAYRTTISNTQAPGTEHYLAWSYTLTSTDISNGYFVPIADMTADADLGAALYTNLSQGGDSAQKYPPPIANQIAAWQRVMWYGDVVATKARCTMQLVRYGAAGMMSHRFGDASFTSGSPTVTALRDTSGLTIGQYITDNIYKGPSAAGHFVPANTTIIAIPSADSITMSHNALATGTPLGWAGSYLDPGVGGPFLGTMPLNYARGLYADQQQIAFTSGSPTVTVPNTAGWAAGMFITDALSGGPTANGTCVPAGTTILAVVNATTITMSANATNNNVAQQAVVGDIITIQGVKFYAWIRQTAALGVDTAAIVPAHCFSASTQSSPYADATGGRGSAMWAMVNFCAAVNAYALANSGFPVRAIPLGDHNSRVYDSGPTPGAGLWGPNGIGQSGTMSVLLEEIGLNQVQFFASSTAGSAIAFTYSPSTFDVAPNRLYWSDQDEPESVPLLNYVSVGAADKRILALVPLRAALLVFKEDGLFRVTGSPPSSWSVSTNDPTLILIRPEAVTASMNQAWAWCTTGFFAVDETGSQSVSAGKLDVELRAAAAIISGDPQQHGTFCVALQRRNLILLGTPGSVSWPPGVPFPPGFSFIQATKETSCGRIYAYNILTQTWGEWTIAANCACESTLDRVYIARPESLSGSGYNEIDVEVRTLGGDPTGYDHTASLGASAATSGTSFTVSQADCGVWRPVIGDFLFASLSGVFYWRRILTAQFAAGTWTFTIPSAFPAGVPDEGAWQFAEAVNVLIEWHPTAPAGSPTGHYARELNFLLDLRRSLLDTSYQAQYVVGASTPSSQGVYTVTSNLTQLQAVQALRVGVSRQVARAPQIAAYLKWAAPYSLAVNSASIVFEGVSERNAR